MTRASTDAALATTTRGWEGEVNDLVDMLGVLLSLLECALSNPSTITELPDTYYLTDSQIRQIFFCAYQSRRMVESFKETYYAAIEA